MNCDFRYYLQLDLLFHELSLFKVLTMFIVHNIFVCQIFSNAVYPKTVLHSFL